QEQGLSDQRALLQASEADLRQRLEEAARLRQEVESERQLFEAEQARFGEHRATLEAAVAQLRKAQDELDSHEAELRQRQEQTEATAAEQAEQAGLLLARAAQLEQAQARLEADRRVLADREAALTRAEQAIAALQEQLRRRSEELAARER